MLIDTTKVLTIAFDININAVVTLIDTEKSLNK